MASSSRAVNISSLEKGTYFITGVKRFYSKYGISILLIVIVSLENAMRVSLHKRFTPVFPEVDIDVINVRMFTTKHMYK